MELNNKKLEKTSRIIYYSISIILCLFLILLSNKIIDDLDATVERPEIEDFNSSAAATKLKENLSAANNNLEKLNSQKTSTINTIESAQANYKNEKQSFDNWIKTRKTLGSPGEDQEVISRARKLDDFYKVENDWRAQLNLKQAEIATQEKQQSTIQEKLTQEEVKAEAVYLDELKRYDLKVFGIRLLFVGPILALGILFFLRYRRHKLWPLYFGFTLFSFYAFFFGLVPYLPSYGGYIRYAVGILLSIGLGYYAIKTIHRYVEQKQAKLKVSTKERAKNVQVDVAEKALENHMCPSCGKDFILKKWEFPLKINEVDAYKLVTDFCRHCGLELFKNCTKCGNKNFAHLPFCSSCGAKPAVD